jgi:hypothetical protein
VSSTKYREFAYDYGTNGYVEHTENPGWGFAPGPYYTTDLQGLRHTGYVHVA